MTDKAGRSSGIRRRAGLDHPSFRAVSLPFISTQGKRHSDTARQIADLLDHFFRPAEDVLVTFDMLHRFGPNLPHPSPDVSVIRGVRDKKANRESFSVKKEGVRPCLIVEVVSPLSSRAELDRLRERS